MVFEGIHSAGKSSQIAALSGWLRDTGTDHRCTSWNSSTPIGGEITRLKIENRMTPTAMALLEAGDLALRFETRLRSVLDRQGIVIADRYVYTGMARGLMRGLDEGFLTSCFSFAPQPDLVFFVSCPPQLTLARRKALGLGIGGHLCGADHEAVTDVEQSFVDYQERFGRTIRTVLPCSAVEISGSGPFNSSFAMVRDSVKARL